MQAKRALITGASNGIGKGIALELAKNGYDICVNYNSDGESAEKVCQAIRALGREAVAVQANVASLPDIDRLFESFFSAFGHIDVLVNNAGITRFKPFLDITPQMFEDMTNVDWRGAFFCAQHAVRDMRAHGGGVIINITSNHQDGQWPYAAVYAPTKAALNKFTRNLALEVARDGIRVVSVAPGYTHAKWSERLGGNPEHQKHYRYLTNRIPVNAFGNPEQIGKACVFLCSDAAAYITGTCLTMDGGALLPNVVENALEVYGQYQRDVEE